MNQCMDFLCKANACFNYANLDHSYDIKSIKDNVMACYY